MKTTSINAASAPRTVGGYSQGVSVDGASRLLYISGQLPERSDGVVPGGFEAQAHQVWSNLLAQLEAASMSPANLVKITTLLSSREYSDANSRIRREYLANCSPALTIIITGIFDERWLLEIEGVAAA